MDPENARWLLIQATSELVPDFFRSLRDDVYPVFEAVSFPAKKTAWRFGELARPAPLKYVRKHKRAGLIAFQERRRTLRKSMLAWAARFHIAEQDTWLLDGALKTLASWREPRLRGDLEHKAAFYKPAVSSGYAPDPFEFVWDGLNLQLLPERECFKSARDEFEKKWRDYAARMRKRAKEQAGGRRVSPEYFAWLALFQFAGLTYEAIHKLYRTRVNDRTAIQKGVKKAAALAGITLRTKL